MKLNSHWLKGLLVLQILLAAILFWNNQQENKLPDQALPADLSPDQIDKIVISSQASSVTLQKQGEDWILPDWNRLPAKQAGVNLALKKLEELKVEWPVTTSSSSHDRFELSEDNYRRRIQLQKGDSQLGEILLGTSPGFRKVHLRLPGEDQVYALELSTHEFSDRVNDWLDKTLLASKNPRSIKSSLFNLTRKQDQWQLQRPDGTALAPDAVDQQKLNQFVSALSNLSVTGVAENSGSTGSEPALELLVEADTSHRYQFYVIDDKYLVKRDGLEAMFTLSKYAYDGISGVGLDDFLAEVDDSNQQQEAETG